MHLRMRFPRARDFPVRKLIPNARVEIDALRESRAKCVGNLVRNVRINVPSASRELDPKLLLHLVINEAADHARRHDRITLQAASGAGTEDLLRLIAPAIPQSASRAPVTVSDVH